MKFKVGDQIIVTNNIENESYYNKGDIGTIIYISEDLTDCKVNFNIKYTINDSSLSVFKEWWVATKNIAQLNNTTKILFGN